MAQGHWPEVVVTGISNARIREMDMPILDGVLVMEDGSVSDFWPVPRAAALACAMASVRS